MRALRHLVADDPEYPVTLHGPGRKPSPPPVAVAGNVDIWRKEKLAIFCSGRCPGSLILRAHDLAQALRQSELAVCGGFHSPVERECLAVLLRGPAPVIVCPARSLANMRLPEAYRQPMTEGRLMLASAFGDAVRRPDREIAARRNEFVAALADAVLIVYAAPGGKTEELARYVSELGKRLLTFEGAYNENLRMMGAELFT